MLDEKDIDGVIVGTGDHQRVLPCMHACQAGKDVYAEKPLTLYVSEGGRWCAPRAATAHLSGRQPAAFHGHEPAGSRFRARW